MRRVAVVPLLAISLTGHASAHRLDEYLQSTLIGIRRDGVDLEIQLTPGVAVLPLVKAEVDRDGDGRISDMEARAYANRVAREVELWVDGIPARLLLTESSFPLREQMEEGLGTIRLRLKSARSGEYAGSHELRFENRHLPRASAYLVNCLAAPGDGLTVGRQERDEAQRWIKFRYSLKNHVEPFWLATVGMLLVVRVMMLSRPWKWR